MVERNGGFTLLEVLVAMAVLALGLGAVMQSAFVGVETMRLQRDRTIADWVAANELNRRLLDPEWPSLGTQQGVSEMVGGRFRWRLSVTPTSDADLRRMTVSVVPLADPDSGVNVEQIAFRGRR